MMLAVFVWRVKVTKRLKRYVIITVGTFIFKLSTRQFAALHNNK